MNRSEININVKKGLKRFMALSLIALPITAYLIYLHFEPSASTICTFSERFDCGIVNKSKYSELLGVPVSILGFLTYSVLFLSALGLYKDFRFQRFHKWLRPFHMLWLMFALTAFGMVFSLYLTYVEAFVLNAWCIFCVTQQVLIIMMTFVLLGILGAIDQEKKKNPDVCEFC